MVDLECLQKNLQSRGFKSSYFLTAAEAVTYLDQKIDQTTVGMGGSMTLQSMGLYDRLGTHNQVFWHHRGDEMTDANLAAVYLSSLNAVAETGELINIDGVGNRVSATIYGPKRVFFVVGMNKVLPDFEQAVWRARNVAAPKNAMRLGAHTPCAKNGDRCFDCNSPDRICRALVVLWGKPKQSEETEVILVAESLGL